MNRILVVDDSASDREAAGRVLEAAGGYYVDFAANADEAIEQLEERLPLAVVTSVQSPELGQTPLVRTVRQRFPHVPVIVMTTRGSEDAALDALLSGATDYVRKSRIESDLIEAVEHALAIRVGTRCHEALASCVQRQEYEFVLDNDVLLIGPLVNRIQNAAIDMGLVDETDCVRLAKALVEALRNAIFHGNLELPFDRTSAASQSVEKLLAKVSERRQQEPYRNRRVHFRADLSRQEAQFAVRDDGPGFDTRSLPRYTAKPAHLVSDGGRGLALIHLFMDQVALNERGNEIRMICRSKPR